MKFTRADRETIRNLVNHLGNDGHTIWKASVLKDAGAGKFVSRFSQTYTSSVDDPKYAITHKGKPIKQLKGVYGLRVLEGICDDLGLEYAPKFGRGSQAVSCTSAIKSWLATPTDIEKVSRHIGQFLLGGMRK
jgi:hypothetical protein